MSEALGEGTDVRGGKVCTACGARYPADALFCPIDGTPLASSAAASRGESEDPYLGQELNGHIEIRQLVGIGAMGRVYRAFQKGIERDVAVKILHRELSANAQLVSRFTREAKVASRLQHPNVVQVLLAGQLPDRALYMAMEYLDGMSLQSALAAAGGALPLSRALHIVLQLCEAVGEAHAQGIVHRDLKPENVMLVRRGADDDFVKVLDFGIARITWSDQSVATAAGLIFGTARYISPEGAQGHAVGSASDVYSIATLLYQMLAGRTPFEGDQAVGLLVQQIHDMAPPLRSIPRATYVPQPLAEVIMANLAKDPQKREPDARSLGHAIFDAAKMAGLEPDEISRPIHRRPGAAAAAMKLPPTERTKAMDLTPEVHNRIAPNGIHSAPTRIEEPRTTRERPISAATTKWEPPEEFQARLADAMASEFHTRIEDGLRPSERPQPVFPPTALSPTYEARRQDRDRDRESRPQTRESRPRMPSGVDETLDDESQEPPPPARPLRTSVPKTMPGEVEPEALRGSTRYSTPAPPPAPSSRPIAPLGEGQDTFLREPKRGANEARTSNDERERRPRGLLIVIACFIVGVALAAGIAWKMGRLGNADDGSDKYVQRAQDAMFKNRFVDPPGENVRDITNEGLGRFPSDKKLIDVRVRAASELVRQAMSQRAAGDVSEALRLARAALELDPTDASAKRLVEQYEAELGSFAATTATPLPSTTPSGKTPVPPAPTSAVAVTAYKVVIDLATPVPKPGQAVEIHARVLPAKGNFEGATFTVTGPSGAPNKIAAQGAGPGVFKGSVTFDHSGLFDVTFTTTADGKPLKASRPVIAADRPASLPTAPPTVIPTAPPTPSATSSVKWM